MGVAFTGLALFQWPPLRQRIEQALLDYVAGATNRHVSPGQGMVVTGEALLEHWHLLCQPPLRHRPADRCVKRLNPRAALALKTMT